MTYVIAEPCIGTKDTACVDACPVDCIHPKKDEPAYATEELLYIDPVECIDCGACVPVCPVSAIFALDDLPEKWNDFTAKQRQVFRPLEALPAIRLRVFRFKARVHSNTCALFHWLQRVYIRLIAKVPFPRRPDARLKVQVPSPGAECRCRRSKQADSS